MFSPQLCSLQAGWPENSSCSEHVFLSERDDSSCPACDTQLSCGANAQLTLGKSPVSGFMPTPGRSVVMVFQISVTPISLAIPYRKPGGSEIVGAFSTKVPARRGFVREV